MAALPLGIDIDYPESDGRPLGETDTHREEIVDLLDALKRRYRNDPNVYVAGNLFVYYEQGNRSAVVSPDVFVVFGVPKRWRRTYKLWVEKKSPSFVIEVTSESTCDEDVDKMRKYARLGVAEYFLFDPLDEYLVPRFQGFRLAGDRYEPIQPDADGGLTSRTTGLRLRVEDERLRLVDAATGEPLLRMQEIEEMETAARRAAEARAESAEARAESAEARAAHETASRRAAEARAAAAEEELARLRRMLQERG
jgi:Uma2 family endonuclease